MADNEGHSGIFSWEEIDTIWDLEEMPTPDEDVEDTPMVDKIDLKEVQANLSALLYIITEQQSLISELLSTLVDAGVLSHEGLVRVSKARKDKELTEAVYKELYKDFVSYYLKTKWILMDGEEKERVEQQLSNPDVGLNSPADEKLPKGER